MSLAGLSINGSGQISSQRSDDVVMQHETKDTQSDGFGDALKGAAVALALVATIPIFIPTAACVLALTEIKEKLKRCPNCGCRKLIFKGKEHRESESDLENRLGQRTSTRRKLPEYSYFMCAACSSRFKKFYGSPLEPASEEEFAIMSPNSF